MERAGPSSLPHPWEPVTGSPARSTDRAPPRRSAQRREHEGELRRPRVEPVLRQHARPAGPGADALHRVIQIDPDGPAGPQPRPVLRRVQLLARPPPRGEPEGLTPSARSPAPSPSVSSAHRTSARAPFSWGRTYGVCIASTDIRHRPSTEAARVSGYASPGPPPNHRAPPYAAGSPNRMPSRGSGTRHSPSGTTDTVSPSRSSSAVHRYAVRSPSPTPAGATLVRTTTASSPTSTASTRCRIRCSPDSRHSAPYRSSGSHAAPLSLSVGARHTSSRNPSTGTAPSRTGAPVTASKTPAPG